MMNPSLTTESITPVLYGPVVGQEKINIPVQPGHSLVDIGDHRVLWHICTGHDEQRVVKAGEEKVVKTGIRQHAAEGMKVAGISWWAVVSRFSRTTIGRAEL